MTPLDFVVSLALISVAAGVLGSLIGLGGERARFLFAPGPPDRTDFASVI